MTKIFRIDDRKTVKLLALLCSLTYIGSYLTRLNFAAVTVDIIQDMGWDKPSVSVVTTGLFITYGIGQLICGWLCDRLNPYKMISAGLSASILMNILIPFCRTIPLMTAVWCVNGFAQAMMWPPIVRILAERCNSEDYQMSSMIVTWGCPIGTMAVYVISSVCAAVSTWKIVFYVCAALAGVFLVLWIVLYPRIIRKSEKYAVYDNEIKIENNRVVTVKMPNIIYLILVPVLLASVAMGALRDSITTWLPSYVSETFDLGSSAAILTGIIIPIITTAIYPLTLKYYQKFFKDELTCSSSIYGMSALAFLVLYFTYDKSPVLSVFLLAIGCAAMHAANFLIVGLIPKRFYRFGKVGIASGLINSFVYIGSSISIWGIAKIAQNSGWQVTIAVWGFLALVGVLLCICCAKKFVSVLDEKDEKNEN